MSNIVVKMFEGKELRAFLIGDEVWFVAKDACDILELSNMHSSIALLDEDEKGIHTVDTIKGKQKAVIVNESGIYSLIFKSRKAEAKKFKKWVTSEVLPSIRKTGSYNAPENNPMWYMRKYNENNSKVPNGFFSMLAETIIVVGEPLAMAGATQEELSNFFADISVGKTFCAWIRSKGFDTDTLPKYEYTSPQGGKYYANLYPFNLMGEFRTFLQNVWIPENSKTYFKKYHPQLLPYLPKLLEKSKDVVKRVK